MRAERLHPLGANRATSNRIVRLRTYDRKSTTALGLTQVAPQSAMAFINRFVNPLGRWRRVEISPHRTAPAEPLRYRRGEPIRSPLNDPLVTSPRPTSSPSLRQANVRRLSANGSYPTTCASVR